MAKGTLVVFSNPVSADREDEYNDWYNQVHVVEACRLPAVAKVSRYKLAGRSSRGRTESRYLAIYQLDDIDVALPAMIAATPNFKMTDALNAADSVYHLYEHIHSHAK